jgi:CBS domain containing-hemolysin-like protein
VEDAIEAVVGELEDEHDIAEQPALSLGASSMVLDGGENIRDLDSQFHIRLPRDQGFETLGGFVMSRLQKIPRGGETFEHDGRRYTVLQMDGHRIKRVKVEIQETHAAERAGD